MPRLPASELINAIEDQAVVIADGAMGTELMRRGALASETLNCNRTHPDWVREIHSKYIEAGARLMYSNTFAPPKSRDEYADVLAGWQILHDVCRESKEKIWAALTLYPKTVCEHPELMHQIFALPNAPDLVIIETCCSLGEAKKAVKEIRRRSACYIFATATFSKNGRMLDGTSMGHWSLACKGNRDIILWGTNCDVQYGSEMFAPTLIKPNAGEMQQTGEVLALPVDIWTELIAARVALPIFEDFRLYGHIVGGCCGTTPDYIRALTQTLAQPKQEQIDFFRYASEKKKL